MLYEKQIPDEEYIRVNYSDLKAFIREVFVKPGVPE